MGAKKSSGFTLIELIVTLVVIAVASVALFGMFNLGVVRSVDPMFRVQAIAVAQGYLEEILLKEYNSAANPAGRANFNDVLDYNGLVDVGARDQFDNGLAGLGQYTIAVAVSASTLGPGGSSAPVRQVTVSVSHPQAGGNVVMTGYRTNY